MKNFMTDEFPTKLIAGVLITGLVLGTSATLSVQWFNDNYQLRSPFQSPIVRKVHSPIPDNANIIIVTPTPTKKPEPTKVPQKKEVGESPKKVSRLPQQMTDREIAEYIKSKSWDYSTAIRLAKSENFWNLTKSFDCARTNNHNTDGSYDVGIFQINSIHASSLAKLGMTMEDMKDCKKNIDFAFSGIYEPQGHFGAWAAFTNKSYLSHSEEI